MKKSTKIVISVISVAVAVALIVVGGLFLSDYSTYSQMISGYLQEEKIISKNDVNEDGNIVLFDDIPYYGYLDKKELTDDLEIIRLYDSESYRATENDDYIISDYKDGVSFDRYTGEDEKVIRIPETIDGKKVVKIGCNYMYHDYPMVLNAFASDYDTPVRIAEVLYIPSGVKDIVRATFWTMNNLKAIEVDENNPYYYSKDGNLYSKENDKLLCAPKYRYYADPEYHFFDTE